MKAQIIVPTYGQEDFTVKCFDSILEYTTDYGLVWVDNGSSEASRQQVLKSFIRHEKRISIWPGKNLGFVGGTNLGIRAILEVFKSDAEYVVLLNNDTEVTAGWLPTMIEAMEQDSSIAAAGPITSCEGSWQGWKNVFRQWGEQISDELHNVDQESVGQYMKDKFGNVVTHVKMIAFFCAVFKKKIFEEVGLLDPQFGAGLGDDDDYCYRMRKAGYKIAFVPGAYVVHHHRTTFKSLFSETEITKMQWDNVAMYRQKHGIRNEIP